MDITWWGVVKAWLFGGGAEGIVDYVLTILNKFLDQSNVADKVSQGYALANKAYGWLTKYASWCPSKWRTEYDVTLDAVKNVVDTFADGKVETEEVNKCIEGFKAAYAAWMED